VGACDTHTDLMVPSQKRWCPRKKGGVRAKKVVSSRNTRCPHETHGAPPQPLMRRGAFRHCLTSGLLFFSCETQRDSSGSSYSVRLQPTHLLLVRTPCFLRMSNPLSNQQSGPVGEPSDSVRPCAPPHGPGREGGRRLASGQQTPALLDLGFAHVRGPSRAASASTAHRCALGRRRRAVR